MSFDILRDVGFAEAPNRTLFQGTSQRIGIAPAAAPLDWAHAISL
jgi:hypothetical protein